MAGERLNSGEKKSIWDNKAIKATIITLAVVVGIGVVVNAVS